MKLLATDVRRPIFSVGVFVDGGHEVSFSKLRGSFFTSRAGHKVALTRQGNATFLPIQIQGNSVAPLAGVPASSRRRGQLIAPVPEEEEEQQAPAFEAVPVLPERPAAAVARDASLEEPGGIDAQPGVIVRAPRAEQQQEDTLAKPLHRPGQLSSEQIARHNLTHTPREEWCPICVEARDKSTAHRSCAERLVAAPAPTLQCDYFFLDIAKELGPCVVLNDRATGNTHASMVFCKGPTCPYSIRSAAAFIHELGHPRILLRTDSEMSS